MDSLLFERGLAASRQRAASLILAGQVTVDDQVVMKAGQMTPVDAQITLKEKDHPFVGRGGQKLAGALDHFRVDPSDFVCVDVGASTGGFTDCLLQYGARKVYAIDVGTNQLDYSLRQDERVAVYEGVNARSFDISLITEPIDLLVADVSFISLRLVIPPFLPALSPQGVMILLIKPQFEAGKERVGKGGVVGDLAAHADVINSLISFFARLGYNCRDLARSPIEGRKGNIEYLALFEPSHEQVCGRLFNITNEELEVLPATPLVGRK